LRKKKKNEGGTSHAQHGFSTHSGLQIILDGLGLRVEECVLEKGFSVLRASSKPAKPGWAKVEVAADRAMRRLTLGYVPPERGAV
jgi:hypothetical protein